jgi:hypothetical protein
MTLFGFLWRDAFMTTLRVEVNEACGRLMTALRAEVNERAAPAVNEACGRLMTALCAEVNEFRTWRGLPELTRDPVSATTSPRLCQYRDSNGAARNLWVKTGSPKRQRGHKNGAISISI